MSYRKPTTYQAITFAGKFIVSHNRSKAFRGTFPDSQASAKTIHESASRFHQTPEVQYQIWRIRAIVRGEIPRDYPYDPATEVGKDCTRF
jgi:hypothetical protein